MLNGTVREWKLMSVMMKHEVDGCIIGIDLGATKLFAGLVDETGELCATRRVATHAKEGGDQELADRISQVIDDLLADAKRGKHELLGIGIGAPGVVDDSAESLTMSPGIAPDDTSFIASLRRRCRCPVLVDNDVNVILLGEAWKGALQGVKNAVCVAIGTGIGVGLLINGEIYRGTHGAAGEMGYWLIGSRGPIRRPEGYGPLELFAAGPGIARRYVEHLRAHGETSIALELTGGNLDNVSAKTVAEAAEMGDSAACQIWQETSEMIGIACANVCSLLDPEVVLISGGVSKVDESLLLDPVREIIGTLAPYQPDVVSTQLGEEAGVLGAVHMVRSSIS